MEGRHDLDAFVVLKFFSELGNAFFRIEKVFIAVCQNDITSGWLRRFRAREKACRSRFFIASACGFCGGRQRLTLPD